MGHVKHAETDHPIEPILVRRWSPYGFSGETVSAEDLRSILEAARWAASSYNEQPWRFIVARRDDPAAFQRALSCLVEPNQAWAKRAGVLLLGVTVRRFGRNGKPNRAAEHDLGLAAGNLSAEATARGLSVHQMIGILPDRVRELYGVPEDAEPLTAIAVGHASDDPDVPEAYRERDSAPRSRRPLADFAFGERWSEPAGLGD